MPTAAVTLAIATLATILGALSPEPTPEGLRIRERAYREKLVYLIFSTGESHAAKAPITIKPRMVVFTDAESGVLSSVRLSDLDMDATIYGRSADRHHREESGCRCTRRQRRTGCRRHRWAAWLVSYVLPPAGYRRIADDTRRAIALLDDLLAPGERGELEAIIRWAEERAREPRRLAPPTRSPSRLLAPPSLAPLTYASLSPNIRPSSNVARDQSRDVGTRPRRRHPGSSGGDENTGDRACVR